MVTVCKVVVFGMVCVLRCLCLMFVRVLFLFECREVVLLVWCSVRVFFIFVYVLVWFERYGVYFIVLVGLGGVVMCVY